MYRWIITGVFFGWIFSDLPPIYLGFPFEIDLQNTVENTGVSVLKQRFSLKIQGFLNAARFPQVP